MNANFDFDIVYCPFYEVTVSIWSDLIDKLGDFPMFILTSLAEHSNNLEKIITATNLNPSTVDDTVRELRENGLLDINEKNRIVYTKLGITYLKVYNYLKAFPKTNSSKIAVNLFTGMLENIHDNTNYASNTPKDNTLPCKISELLIKNHNFSNIKEFMKDKIDLLQFSISDDDYEYINFDLKPKQRFYVPYVITKDSILSKDKGENEIMLIVPIEKVTHILTHKEVDANKDIIGKLIDVANFNESLLSEDGMQLVYIQRKISELSGKKIYFYDCYTGNVLNYPPNILTEKDCKTHNIPKITLKKRVQRKRDSREHENGFIDTPIYDTLLMKHIISFDSLVKMEDFI